MSNNHQANAVSNGWNFEYAAALFLFLQYIAEIDEIGIEKEEDIVLKLKNQHHVVAQSKSSLETDEIYNKSHYSEIHKSLDTLNSASIELDNIDEYISINNYRKPFGNDSPFDLTNDEERKDSFVDMPALVKDNINSYCDSKGLTLDRAKLFFWFVKYESTNKDYYIRRVLNSKLSFLGSSAISRSDTLFCKLMNQIANNGSDKHNSIKATKLLGILFSTIVEGEVNVNSIASLFDLDEDEIGFEDDNYIKGFFDSYSQDFTVYSDIVADFINYCEANSITNKKKARAEYIKTIDVDNAPDYFKSYFMGSEYNIELLYKLYIGFIIYKQSFIEDIKEVFNVTN